MYGNVKLPGRSHSELQLESGLYQTLNPKPYDPESRKFLGLVLAPSRVPIVSAPM
jgi:hypothetical protein